MEVKIYHKILSSHKPPDYCKKRPCYLWYIVDILIHWMVKILLWLRYYYDIIMEWLRYCVNWHFINGLVSPFLKSSHRDYCFSVTIPYMHQYPSNAPICSLSTVLKTCLTQAAFHPHLCCSCAGHRHRTPRVVSCWCPCCYLPPIHSYSFKTNELKNFNSFETQMSLCHFFRLQWLPRALGMKLKPFLILPLPASQAHLLLTLICSFGLRLFRSRSLAPHPAPPQLVLNMFPSASHHHIALVCFPHSTYLWSFPVCWFPCLW